MRDLAGIERVLVRVGARERRGDGARARRADRRRRGALGACVAAGGVAVFPADTVYGLACDPENADAVAKLYALKGRPPEKPAAVMFFDLVEPGDFGGLLPGGVTLLLPNPERRFPLACTTDPETLGIRVPFLAPVGRPVLQSSANLAGGPDARRLDEVPESHPRRAPTSCSTAASCPACPRRWSTCGGRGSGGSSARARSAARTSSARSAVPGDAQRPAARAEHPDRVVA